MRRFGLYVFQTNEVSEALVACAMVAFVVWIQDEAAVTGPTHEAYCF